MPTAAVRAPRRRLVVSRAWVQAAALVALSGVFVLVLMGWRTYQSNPPIPDQVVSQSGRVVFTGADVRAGQDVFLRNGLMEYGSIFGHGAYLGPDFTADYLHRAAEQVHNSYGGSASDSASTRTENDFKANRYDAATRTLTVSDAQADSFDRLIPVYAAELGNPWVQP